jgi:Cof subfamily protein (haloacid dehalogenase superfamily)
MKKIVFFDIDGTLLDHNKKLPSTTKEAVKKLKQLGVEVAIATGRAPFMFSELCKELDINTFVSFNGSYVVYDGEVIYKQPLPITAIKKLEGMAREKDHPMVFLDEQRMLANEKDHPHIHKSIESLKFTHPPYNPTYYHNNDIYQALLFCTAAEEEVYVNEFPHLFFVRWHEVSTDILPFGGSKAVGIEQMLARLDYARENVYAFGDGINDIEMLQYVGTGVAMGNAGSQLKSIADVVTKDVDEDGIVYGLRKVGLLV